MWFVVRGCARMKFRYAAINNYNGCVGMMRLATFIVVAIPLLLFGCGKWPPIANSADDIRKMSPSETSIRARGLADVDLPALTHFKHLQQLDFDGGWGVQEAKITDQGLKILSELNLPELNNLALGHNNNITDEGLRYLVAMRSVKYLGLSVVPGMSDDGLKYLARMSTLDILDLRGCTTLTDDGLIYLETMENIKQIWFGGCSQVTQGAVANLANKLPQAKVTKDDTEWAYHRK